LRRQPHQEEEREPGEEQPHRLRWSETMAEGEAVLWEEARWPPAQAGRLERKAKIVGKKRAPLHGHAV
jgi:hypothetical protein